jgi:hypothetical protein
MVRESIASKLIRAAPSRVRGTPGRARHATARIQPFSAGAPSAAEELVRAAVLVPSLLSATAMMSVPLALGCCNARTVTQTGLIPFAEPDPPPSTQGAASVFASGSGLTHLDATGEPTSGGYTPVGQIHVGVTLRPRAGFTISPRGMAAFSDGAAPSASGTPPTTAMVLPSPGAPRTTTIGFGLEFGWTFGDERVDYLVRPHLGINALVVGSVVSDPAPGAAPQTESGWMAVLSGGLDLGYWLTPWLLVVGGIDLRNTPTMASTVTACVGDAPPFLDFGDFTVTTRVSGEILITPDLGLFGGVAIPTYGSPYASYPILTGGVRGTFGEGATGLAPGQRNAVVGEPARERHERAWAPAWGSGAGP